MEDNESHVLTELTPVVIENVYGEMTEAKVPYRNDNCNTDSSIDAEAASPAQTYNTLMVLYRGLPKEMFVNRVVLNKTSCEVTLEN